LKREALKGANPQAKNQEGGNNQILHRYGHSPINPIFYNSSTKPYSTIYPNKSSTSPNNTLDIENGQNLKNIQQISHEGRGDVIDFHD
jgi:hypothetical protein